LKWKEEVRGGRERRRCAEKRGCKTLLRSDGEIHDMRVKNSSLS
jgi:hypothetical protein